MSSIWSNENYDVFFRACGGIRNILQLENCTTRLRVLLLEKDNYSKDTLMTLPGVKMILERRNELQLVIGLDVFNIEKECLERMKKI